MQSRSGSIDLNAIKAGLAAGAGGYAVAHESPGLFIGYENLTVLVIFARTHEASTS